MKACVSGSSGFVGTHLMDALLRENIFPVPIPRDVYYDPVRLTKLFEKERPDYIFHLASYGNMHHQKDVVKIINANILGTENMLESSLKVNYKAFVNVSSSSVLLPYETFYSATKASAEHLCNAFANEFKKPVFTIRPYSLYGPGEADFRFIPTVFRSCLLGEGMVLDPKAVHDWVYISDFINVLIDNARHGEELKGLTGEVGTGKGTTNEQIVKLIEKITGERANIIKTQKIRNYDNKEWIAENKNNITTIAEGLIKVYEYYKQGSEKEDFRN